MNWGYKIAVGYTLFVILILALVYLSSKQKVDLVTEDYYQQEIEYQDKIDKKKNVNTLSSPISIDKVDKQILIQFPAELHAQELTGNIFFYRPDDKMKDQTFPIELNEEGAQEFNIDDFTKGYYKIKIEWAAGKTEYYQEKNIFI